MSKKQFIEIGNIAWFIYLCYIILILLAELADLVCYIAGCPQTSVISRVIVVFAFVIIFLLVKNRIHLTRLPKRKSSWFVFILFLIIGIIKGISPDISLDVSNYHLLAQTPGFMDAFGYHVAPGDFQFFGFRLPDRMFYLFRMILGFRMGTLLNSLVVFLIYLQVRDILTITLDDKLSVLRNRSAGRMGNVLNRIVFNEDVIALAIVLTHDSCMQFASYMVDMFAIPIALEMIRILLKKETADKAECTYYAFLAGLMFCMKMTNIVYMLPLLLYFLIKNRKSLTIPLFTGCFVLALIPVSIYLCYNFLETGNPVFPYYNKIFQSKYFPVINFKDTRWGFSNLQEYLLWPFYMVFKPEYRQSEIANSWAIGSMGMFVAAIWFVAEIIRNKRTTSSCAPVHVVFIVSYFLWAYTTGHIRYFLLGYLLGGIILIELLVTALHSWKKWYWKVIPVILTLLFAVGPYKYLSEVFSGHEWSWRAVSTYEIEKNREYVFNDYALATTVQRDKVDVFLMNDSKSTGSIASQINNTVPIIFNSYAYNRLDQQMLEQTQDRINQYFSQGLGVYDVYYAGGMTLDNQIANMNAFGVKLISCEWLNNIYPGKESYILMELDSLSEGEQNVCCYANKDTKNQIRLIKTADSFSMTLHAGYTVNYGWYPQDNIYLQVKISDEAGHEYVSLYPVMEGAFYTLNLSEDLSHFDENITVDYRLVHGDGTLFDVNGPNPFAVLTYDVVGGEILY